MTWNEMLIKNLKAHARKFLSYFLCNSLAIMILFMFFLLLFNRAVQQNLQYGTRDMMMACTIAIIVFIIGFSNYSYWTFAKSRQSEFGLLSILGMTPKDLNRQILAENSMIAVSSLFVGILSGGVFARLFFMVVTHILQKDSKFEMGFEAYGATVAVFAVVYLIMNLMGGYMAKKLEPIEILKQRKKAEKGGVRHPLLLLLGFLMILAAYTLKYLEIRHLIRIQEISTKFILIMFTGLYIFISQAGGALLAFFQKRKRLFLPRMLTITELSHKIAANQNVIYLMCFLSALIMYFMGDSFTKYLFGFNSGYYETNSGNLGFVSNPAEGMLLLYVSIFMAVLFFISAGCMINFKLFNEIDPEKRRFMKLYRVGITQKEGEKYLSAELKILFFVPLAAGVLLVYPFVIIDNLPQDHYRTIIGYFTLMNLLYGVLQTGFYFLTKHRYIKQITWMEED